VHVLYPGRAACGVIAIADIGVEPGPPAAGAGPDAEVATESAIAALLPRRGPTTHKGACGRVLVVGGSVGLTGAVVLASNAALRAGAGLVTAGVPASLGDALESAMIEPMKWPLPESPGRALGADAAPLVIARAREVQAVALGPGLSRAAGAAELARGVIAGAEVPIVLDADGLNAFAGRAGDLARRAPGTTLVVTPHVGEMQRLSGLAPEEIERGRLAVPAGFARAWNAVVVLKGAPTVIAAPDGRVTVNPTGNPGMATAGMGDVLSGVLGSLLVQTRDLAISARAGVLLHALAGDAAAQDGERGTVASDLLPQLRRWSNRT
jgi:NAD(P)H-hydrate epimerase